jgi:hypothetical protein
MKYSLKAFYDTDIFKAIYDNNKQKAMGSLFFADIAGPFRQRAG